MRKKLGYILLLLSLLIFTEVLWSGKLVEKSRLKILGEDTLISAGYREQNVGEDMLKFLQKTSNPGKYVGIYFLETKYGYQPWKYDWTIESYSVLERKWKQQKEWQNYLKTTQAIWDEVDYFPVPEFTNTNSLTVSYVNTWMAERSYGGTRGHEGTDIMASKNERGLYPIISMTDGTVTKKGWLEKG